MATLRDHLHSTGEAQTAFARRASISTSYLSQLLSGFKTPGLDVAVRIERLTSGAVPASSWIADVPCQPRPEEDAA